MKNKKGFTIVELVIVIAVIAILAAVLIPTFTTVTANARASAAQQVAKTAQEAILGNTEGTMPENTLFVVSNDNDADPEYLFLIKERKLDSAKIGTINTLSSYPVYKTENGEKNYIVFVTADYFGEAEKYNKVKGTVEGLVNYVLKANLGDDEGVLTATNVTAAGNEFAEWTFAYHEGEDAKTANITVYYNADMSADCVVFYANN